jgi:hypothetical protein
VPIDVASLPALQIQMDPAHTEVLNALVTQVGALGNAVGHLADRVGVPIAVPPGPPLLTPTPSGRRRRHGAPHVHHAAARDEPVVVQQAPPPAAREFDDITSAMQTLPKPAPVARFEWVPDDDRPAAAPSFIAPVPEADPGWPSDDEIDAFVERRQARDNG